jgi:disulfide oxidoreductase YuzD
MEQALTEFSKELQKRYPDTVELSYIDTDFKSYGTYPNVEKLINQGHSYPIVLVNGKFMLAGGTAAEITEAIQEIIIGTRKQPR